MTAGLVIEASGPRHCTADRDEVGDHGDVIAQQRLHIGVAADHDFLQSDEG